MGMREIDYVKPNELIIVGLDTLDDETHPLYDHRIFLPVDENLVRNISFYGIQQPVLVRREGDKLYVIDGRQRTRAAREAAKRQALAGEYQLLVPVREARGDDKRVVGIMISTNEQRQNDEVLEKAFKAARMLDLCGDMDQVALAFGRTKTTIKNWMSLVEADPCVHEAIRSGLLSAQAAVEIARYERSEQRSVVERLTQKVADGGQVSGSMVTEIRVEDGKSSATKAHQAAAAATKTDNKASHNQKGIKRMWLRKAIKSKAAANLTREQLGVLQWFASGESHAEDWFGAFQRAVERELSGQPEVEGGESTGESVQPNTDSESWDF